MNKSFLRIVAVSLLPGLLVSPAFSFSGPRAGVGPTIFTEQAVVPELSTPFKPDRHSRIELDVLQAATDLLRDTKIDFPDRFDLPLKNGKQISFKRIPQDSGTYYYSGQLEGNLVEFLFKRLEDHVEWTNIYVSPELRHEALASNIGRWLLNQSVIRFPQSRFPLEFSLVNNPQMLRVAYRLFKPETIQIYLPFTDHWIPIESLDLYKEFGPLRIHFRRGEGLDVLKSYTIAIKKGQNGYEVEEQPDEVQVNLQGPLVKVQNKADGQLLHGVKFNVSCAIRGEPASLTPQSTQRQALPVRIFAHGFHGASQRINSAAQDGIQTLITASEDLEKGPLFWGLTAMHLVVLNSRPGLGLSYALPGNGMALATLSDRLLGLGPYAVQMFNQGSNPFAIVFPQNEAIQGIFEYWFKPNGKGLVLRALGLGSLDEAERVRQALEKAMFEYGKSFDDWWVSFTQQGIFFLRVEIRQHDLPEEVIPERGFKRMLIVLNQKFSGAELNVQVRKVFANLLPGLEYSYAFAGKFLGEMGEQCTLFPFIKANIPKIGIQGLIRAVTFMEGGGKVSSLRDFLEYLCIKMTSSKIDFRYEEPPFADQMDWLETHTDTIQGWIWDYVSDDLSPENAPWLYLKNGRQRIAMPIQSAPEPHPQIEIVKMWDDETIEHKHASLETILASRFPKEARNAEGKSPFAPATRVPLEPILTRIAEKLSTQVEANRLSTILLIGPAFIGDILGVLASFPDVKTLNIVTAGAPDIMEDYLIRPLTYYLHRNTQISTRIKFYRGTVLALTELLEEQQVDLTLMSNVLDLGSGYFGRGQVRRAYEEIAASITADGLLIVGGKHQTRPVATLWEGTGDPAPFHLPIGFHEPHDDHTYVYQKNPPGETSQAPEQIRFGNVVFEKLDPRFVGQMGVEDKTIFEKLLSADLDVQQDLLDRFPEKVYASINERNMTCTGRTLYLQLDKPIRLRGRELPVLRIKGIRPRSTPNGNVLPYDDFLAPGNPSRGIRILEEGGVFSVDGTNFEPFGGMVENRARMEYELMDADIPDVPRDCPIGVGIVEGKTYEGRGLGVVIAGMEGTDQRMYVKRAKIGESDQFVIQDFKTGSITYHSPEQSKRFWNKVGAMIRAYHEAGDYHRALYPGNIGVRLEKNGDYAPVLRDLDPTIVRSTIGRPITPGEDAAYRWVDLESPLEWFLKNDCPDLVGPFLKGYFQDMNSELSDLKQAIWQMSRMEWVERWEAMYFHTQRRWIYSQEDRLIGSLWKCLLAVSNPISFNPPGPENRVLMTRRAA